MHCILWRQRGDALQSLASLGDALQSLKPRRRILVAPGWAVDSHTRNPRCDLAYKFRLLFTYTGISGLGEGMYASTMLSARESAITHKTLVQLIIFKIVLREGDGIYCVCAGYDLVIECRVMENWIAVVDF